jgi:hypothetical protein
MFPAGIWFMGRVVRDGFGDERADAPIESGRPRAPVIAPPDPGRAAAP